MAESVFMRALLILMVLASIIAFPKPLFADTTCQPIYGGGQTCNATAVSIEKDVVNPMTNSDVHDLGVNDPQFHPGDTITFHITIRNTGSSNMSGATITDTFPQFISFNSGPGNFNTNNNTLNFQTGTLVPNQSQTFTVTARVADASQIPNIQPNCPINQVAVFMNGQQVAQDSSQFCIQSPVSTVSSTNPTITAVATPQVVQTPATGASGWLLGFMFPIGISGFFLQGLAKRSKT